MTQKPPSPKQLTYLKALAQRTGQTFQWPKTSVHASREIRRLKNTTPSTSLERAIERYGDPEAIEAAQDAAIVHDFEVLGCGSDCTWSQRS